MKERKKANERIDVISVRRTQIWLLGLTVAIAAISFILALPTITNWFKKTFIREPDYVIKVLDTAYRLPDNVYKIPISESYIVKMHISAPTRVRNLSGIKFSTKYENVGKKLLENPYLQVYLVDSLNRVFAEWESEVSKEKLRKGVLLKLDPTTARGKEVYGAIHILTLAYDRTGDKIDLVGYLLYSVDIGPSLEITLLLVSGVVMTSALMLFTSGMLREKREEKEQRAKEAKEKSQG